MKHDTHITHATYLTREGSAEPIAAKFTVAAPPGYQRTFTVIDKKHLSKLYSLSADPAEFCNIPIRAIYRGKRMVRLNYTSAFIASRFNKI